MNTTTTTPSDHRTDEERHRVAPWWMGYVFLLPLRRLWENPRRMLSRWISPGDRIVELGCSMGFFSLDLARMVGSQGRVYAIDIQPRVLEALDRRAVRAGLDRIIEPRLGTHDDPRTGDLRGSVDLVHAHHVLHEVRDRPRMVGHLAATLRPGGLFYLAEPDGHVSRELFMRECELLREAGLEPLATPRKRRQQTTVYRKPV